MWPGHHTPPNKAHRIEFLQENEENSYREKCSDNVATVRTKSFKVKDLKGWMNCFGWTVATTRLLAEEEARARKGSTHKSYAFRLQEPYIVGPQERFVFRLLFNKRDLFSLSVPNSEESTAFTLGPSFTFPPHSVKHSYSILSADLSVFDSYKHPGCCLCKRFSWVSHSHRGFLPLLEVKLTDYGAPF